MNSQLPPSVWTVVALGVSAALFWLLCRSDRVRQAFRLVTSAPAFLVPAAMVLVATAVFLGSFSGYAPAHENPLGMARGSIHPGFGEFAHHHAANWVMLVCVAVLLAGHVGLLEAHAQGRKPNAEAFLIGIRSHVLTIGLGKVVIVATVWAISTTIAPDSALAIVYLVPSLFLAPLVGLASTSPGRPFQALRRAIGFTHENLSLVGRLVTAQVVLLAGLLIVYGRLAGFATHELPLHLLAITSSTLSFNQFPFALFGPAPWINLVVVLVSTLASTVFVTAHWLGVTQGYLSPREHTLRA